ncbi:MAG: 3'-5' exonuclease [Abditibacteriota bacterium]|nr:3'-5' exonuclease [Abditibacteriota bacterium]
MVPTGQLFCGLPSSYVCLDLETTGFSPEKGSEIIEVAAVLTDNFRIEKVFSQTVRPRGPIPEFITGLTGISPETVRFSPDIGTVMPLLLEFAGDMPIVGHNVLFDLRFISYYAMESLGVYFLNPYRDTVGLSRSVFSPRRCGKVSHSLTALADRLNIEYPNAHRALADTMATHECYKALVRMITEEELEEDML